MCLPLSLIAGWYGMNFFLYAGAVVAVRLSDGSRNQRTGTGITAVAIPPEGVLVGEKDIVHHLSEINCIKKCRGGISMPTPLYFEKIR